MSSTKRVGVLIASLIFAVCACAQESAAPKVKVGVTSIMSGDLGVLGRNIADTAETYRKHYLRHPLEFVYEDAKLSSADGLSAYQKLINLDKVDLIIGGCSSNGTMAGKAIINSTKTPTITVVTGGRNIDAAGPYIFRIGNSDIQNGIEEADAFYAAQLTQVALLTEETEYTQDIASAFKERFLKLGGKLVYDENFTPGISDFRTQISKIKRSGAQGIFIPTQTGTALGIFVKQWVEQGGSRQVPIHTSFVAAPNADAHKIAGDAIVGIKYMAPKYDGNSARLKEFVEFYQKDHGHAPPIMFHTAGTVDALDLLQRYLDKYKQYDRERFQNYLVTEVKDYDGLMGRFSFDADGNSALGFEPAEIATKMTGAK
ncbi:MAG: ABC transporter substrate-binding protein [Oligoflexia bacterium]|nr:ABC transporter substrate-binding protein [Oligoflexia bacterium]